MGDYVFFEDKYMPLSEAKIGVLTHALHYGTAIFEGIRATWIPIGSMYHIFRMRDHYERMLRNCKLLDMSFVYTPAILCKVTQALIRQSGYEEDLYIRPLAYKSSQSLGIRLHDLDCEILIVAIKLPPLLGKDVVHCCTSSWRRVNDPVIPPRGKICGGYVNNAFAKTEAVRNGYDEGIMITEAGFVSETGSQNVMFVDHGELVSPMTTDCILPGITRDSVMQLAQDANIPVIERHIHRSEMYNMDECFLCGTATDIVPVGSIDRKIIGDGKPGKLTMELSGMYESAKKGGWGLLFGSDFFRLREYYE